MALFRSDTPHGRCHGAASPIRSALAPTQRFRDRFCVGVTRRSTVIGMASDAAAATAGVGNSAADQSRAGTVAAEAVVQKQLEAYNARDIDAFMALMAEDCVAKDAVTGAVMAQGTQQLRQRYESRFKTDVHSELLGRLCLGDVVVDREFITGLPDGAAADCLATYHCKDGKIVRMEFVWQPRK